MCGVEMNTQALTAWFTAFEALAFHVSFNPEVRWAKSSCNGTNRQSPARGRLAKGPADEQLTSLERLGLGETVDQRRHQLAMDARPVRLRRTDLLHLKAHGTVAR